MTPRDLLLERLTADARYHRERYDLYRAKVYALRPTTQGRLDELRRTWEAAETRLATARATGDPDSPAGPAAPESSGETT